MMKNNATAKNIGDMGEQLIAKYLKLRFYRIISKNYTVKGGELDIVSVKGKLLVFTEVKTRSEKHTEIYGRAANAVDREKIRHIKIAAKKFVSEHSLFNMKVRFDVAEVYINGKKHKINYIKDAFI